MPDPSVDQSRTLSIAAVERDTGLSKDTLRVWERRYGFPAPQRNRLAERAYPMAQVEKLRILKRLIDAGHRPGRIVGLPMEALQQLSDDHRMTPDGVDPPIDIALRRYVEQLRAHDIDGLRRQLLQAQAQLGLGRFINQLLSPLNTMIGDAWMRGQLEIFQEHLYTELVTVVLRQAIASVARPDTGTRPSVLLTTVPNELHGLGLLMAEALLLIEGCRCVNLGPQTPIWDIALAATALQVDVVALAFTASLTPAAVIEGLTELRRKLPPTVELWVGGSAPVLHRRPVGGVQALAALPQLVTEVRRWHTVHGAAQISAP